MRRLLSVFFFFCILAALAFAGVRMLDGVHNVRAASPPNIAAVAVDMDPASAPANTTSVVGTIQPCARINENNVQDADEDAVDQLFVDVTAVGIPAGSSAGAVGMIGYSYQLAFPDTHLSIPAKTIGKLSTAVGYNPFSAGDPVPDAASPHAVDLLDLGAAGVLGDGFLERYTF